MAYKHGLYAQAFPSGSRATENVTDRNVPVYIGTLPVHTAAGGATRVNTPILLNDFAQAVKLVGYSDDWASYTLCEAIYVHLVLRGVGPICVINVFDPNTGATEKSATVTAKNNQIALANMGNAMIDSVAVTGKDAADYTISYDYNAETLTIKGKKEDVITGEVTVSYKEVDPSGVTDAMVAGTSDGEGTDTGVHLVRQVYQATNLIPNRILAPGFTQSPVVRAAMLKMSEKVNGHFDAFIYTDIPLADEDGSALKPSGAAAWKNDNGYTADNEKTHWPMWEGTDGRKYHLSTFACAILQGLESGADGIPYQTCSNNDLPIGGKLYHGENAKIALDEQIVNEQLNANGITSAIFHGGRWVLWGAHTASYTQDGANRINVSETNLAMMYYITNDFQVRRADDIDKPMSKNRLAQIIAEEQAMLDALGPTGVGALLYGKANAVTGAEANADMLSGDYTIEWHITQTPNTKSITGRCIYTEEGLKTYFEEGE